MCKHPTPFQELSKIVNTFLLVTSLSKSGKAERCFEILRPLCLKGLHLSLRSLPSGKGETENRRNRRFTEFWYRSQSLCPKGRAMSSYRLAQSAKPRGTA